MTISITYIVCNNTTTTEEINVSVENINTCFSSHYFLHIIFRFSNIPFKLIIVLYKWLTFWALTNDYWKCFKCGINLGMFRMVHRHQITLQCLVCYVMRDIWQTVQHCHLLASCLNIPTMCKNIFIWMCIRIFIRID